jgi:CubicO group peptidase (beta-lactamase class C family)
MSVPEFIDYHGVTPSFHRDQTHILPRQGFRLVSLSVFDFSFHWFFNVEPRYTAVWLRRRGRPQRFVQDLDAAGFQSAFDQYAGAGFKPTIIAATTSIFGTDRFAAVFEETTDRIPLTRHGLVSGPDNDQGTIEFWTREARLRGWRPTTLTVYGTANRPRFAGVWEPNRAAVAWSTDGLTDTLDAYQQRFNAQATALNRPAYVTVSPSVRYLSLFQDDQIDPRIQVHGITDSEYQSQRDEFESEGFFPLSVQAGGNGGAVRYAALFVQKAGIIRRQFTLADSPDLQRNDVDNVIEDMMVAYGIRQAALAVVYGTRLLFARGYTFAEPDYPQATATTYFRVASLSKVLTAMVVMQLAEQGHLRLDDRIQDVLQLTTPAGGPPIDARFDQVTIEQALTLYSGLRHKWDEGPAVVGAFGASLPATREQIARYAIGQPGLMLRDPGQRDPERLSDFGYLLVSLLVEQILGPRAGPFAQIVHDRFGVPVGATRIRSGVELVAGQPQDEAKYHAETLALDRSVMSDDQPLVPVQYGHFSLYAMPASGGLSVGAVDFARVLAALNLRAGNPVLSAASIDTMLRDFIGWDAWFDDTPPGSFHRVKGGLLDGLQSVANFTQGDHFPYVLYWAKDSLPPRDDRPPDPDHLWYPEFPPLEQAIRSTIAPGARDRFPDFGMAPL